MQSLLEKINAEKIWPMSGGVHPPQRKEISNRTAISKLPLPEKIFVPLQQSCGDPYVLKVAKGDVVFKGQPLTETHGLPTHASSSGRVVDIIQHVSPHPSGIPETTVVIEPDGKDLWLRMPAISELHTTDKQILVERIKQAGIAGMGGAGFPTFKKVGQQKKVAVLIINAAECEPYITTDDRLMREYSNEIMSGIDVLNYLLSPSKIVIAIEDNKPEAIDVMTAACSDKEHISVAVVPTVYPAGGEDQLIQMLTGIEVPSEQYPIDIGIVSQNVATCFAISRAVFHGEPLVERVVTVTGLAIDKPGNYWMPIGTPIQHVLQQCQNIRQANHRVIMGGPMMGFTVVDDLVPIVKITNCLLIPTEKEMPIAGNEQPCIRCSKCADACPVRLLPQQLYWYSKNKEYDKAQDYDLFDCIECGACAFVCPSQIPLVQYYRTAKADIRQQKADKEKSDKAKLRFEARKERLEQEKIAREEKHRLAAEARKAAQEKNGSNQKDVIAAALARAKAKKAQQADANNSSNSTSETSVVNTEPKADQADNKKAAIAAAIAKAKAKQAAAKNEDDS